MIKKTLFIAVSSTVLWFTACQNRQYSIAGSNHRGYSITTTDTVYKPDSGVLRLISPYKLALDSQMNQIIGSTDTDLANTRPNGLLANFIADVMRTEATKLIGENVDFAFSNQSGFRIPSLPKGTITRGKVFELMPFDNKMVIAKINGATMKLIINMIAAKGGEAISGARLVIKEKQLVSITFNDIMLDSSKTYIICTNDFLFTGGDGYTMFKEGVITLYPTDVLLRDMLISHISTLHKANQPISQTPDERITIQ